MTSEGRLSRMDEVLAWDVVPYVNQTSTPPKSQCHLLRTRAGLTGDRKLIDGYFASHLHLHIDIDIDIYMCVCVCVTLGGQPRPTPWAAPTQVSPRHKTPTVVWRATVSRLGGERVRPVCGLCGSVSLSRASRPIPSPDQSAAPSLGRHSG